MSFLTNVLTVGAAVGIGAATGSMGTAALMGFSAYASLQAGDARASNYEDQMRLGLLAAEEAMMRGRYNATLTLQHGKQTVGQQRNLLAARGISAGAGSALEMKQESLYNAHAESKRIMDEATFAADMRRQGALAYGEQAQRERTSSLLTTVAGVANTGYQFYRADKP
jgi:hypothetical protein